ncbi:hypothetical protein MWN34_08325 [Ancylobacter sp. 6x-1]|uniref:Porin n=1 Tax=Ancylobacter crimeensis TaxID=2579147 RepID=A0ABT0DAF2_9HYPH|nr:hypothetical protein [Ancylobacter crimeensis]MCK0196917.1 hypothetical protein [Ancylobacter crimeensis]
MNARKSKESRAAGRAGVNRAGAGVLLLAAMLLATPSQAGSQPFAGRNNAPANATAAAKDPLCASYGPGFVRVAGGSTCVRVSGSVQSDAYVGSGNTSVSGSATAPALTTK